jgi:hypothetical protein
VTFYWGTVTPSDGDIFLRAIVFRSCLGALSGDVDGWAAVVRAFVTGDREGCAMTAVIKGPRLKLAE